MNVNIVGLHKADVLLALYNHASFGGPDFPDSSANLKHMVEMAALGRREDAEKEIEKRNKNADFRFDYVDLGSGPRPLRVDLSGFDFDPTGYDKAHGAGAAQAVVTSLWRKDTETTWALEIKTIATALYNTMNKGTFLNIMLTVLGFQWGHFAKLKALEEIIDGKKNTANDLEKALNMHRFMPFITCGRGHTNSFKNNEEKLKGLQNPVETLTSPPNP